MEPNDTAIFVFGLASLFVLGAVVAKRLARDYRSREGASLLTVALVWSLAGLHFSLVVLAVLRSTWHFSLPAPLTLGGGIALAALGGAICLSAMYAFGSLKSLNFLNETRRVTEGIYRWSRNPQLVGWTLVLVGLGLVSGSALVLFLAVVGWVGYRLHLPTEEERLRRTYGDAYEEYRCRTHRNLGRPGRHRTR